MRNLNLKFIAIFSLLLVAIIIIVTNNYYNSIEDKERWKDVSQLLSNILGPALAFVNMFLFAWIAKRLWSEDHHMWITQERMDNLKDIKSRLNLSKRDIINTPEKISDAIEYFKDEDLNLYFHLAGNQLLILNNLSSQLLRALEKLKDSPTNDSSHHVMEPISKVELSLKKFKESKTNLLKFLHLIILKEPTHEFNVYAK